MSAFYLVLSYICEAITFCSLFCFIFFIILYVVAFFRNIYRVATHDYPDADDSPVTQSHFWIAGLAFIVGIIGWFAFASLAST